MKFMAEATQRQTRIEAFRIVEASVPVSPSAATGTITNMPEGFTRGTIQEGAASNQNYTLTFTQPFARAPVATITALESGAGVSYICNIVSITASAVVWRVENDASAAGNATGFHVIVVGSDSADVI